jgi:four helix bundle protein
LANQASKIQSHRDLVVWQKAMALNKEAYRLAMRLPRTEQYRLVDQLLRAAISVPTNIAEGHSRGTRKDYANFVSIARGSVAEVDTILQLTVEVELLRPDEVESAMSLSLEVSKILAALLNRLREPPPRSGG